MIMIHDILLPTQDWPAKHLETFEHWFDSNYLDPLLDHTSRTRPCTGDMIWMDMDDMNDKDYLDNMVNVRIGDPNYNTIPIQYG